MAGDDATAQKVRPARNPRGRSRRNDLRTNAVDRCAICSVEGISASALQALMINGLTNSESVPVLERLLQFTEQRHRLIANNVANISTPGFRPTDVSPEEFQKQLGEAVEERRASGSKDGDLHLENSSQIEFTRHGVKLNAQPSGENILFHDGNDRNVERVMQSLVENTYTFRTATQLLKNQFELLTTAIRERL
jgi:flagellar basal-body rod protein FlgB